MKKIVKMSMVAVMMMGVGAVSAQAEGTDILTNIKVNGQVRARYEMVDADDAANKANANALTNRLALGVGADLLGTNWLSAYAEMIDVRALNNNYFDGYDGLHDTVADPEQTRLSQAYVDLKMGKTKLRVGRQAINLDNVRFVGNSDWRQMPQTFDAYTLMDNTIDNLSLFASYITQVDRLFDSEILSGPHDGKWDTRSVLLNASYKVMPELRVIAYDYMISQGTGGTTGSDTYGLALTGDIVVSDALKLNYRAEYAKQTDPTMENSGVTGNVNVDADYMNIELGANASGFLVGAQYEVLSGTNGTDGNTAFSTPFFSGHPHNGWADVVTSTQTAGLEDMSIMAGYTSKAFGTAKVIYHDYTSEVGSIDYGTELNAVYIRAIPGVNNLTGMLKVADFDADVSGGKVDTTKFWAMLDLKFATK
ncbi:MAG: hypothetical protein QG617_1340 [Campylobacterota bacterium]|nr:hypothetical protein [Campylobacterota bacterium]